MRPDDADHAHILDMLRYAKSAIASTEARDFSFFETNEDHRLANERRLEIIGEAARHVSEATRSAYPDVPWRKIITHRHVLAHDYGEIKSELIWRVLTQHLPGLVVQLEAIASAAKNPGTDDS